MTHRSWILFSGFLWLVMGLWLLNKGLHLTHNANWIAIGLAIGFIKGRFILAKTVRRVVGRILSLPLPIRAGQVYAKSYWFLISGMMGLGMLMRFFPNEVRGVVDVTIGSALINGAMLYFRATYGIETPSQSQKPDKAAQ